MSTFSTGLAARCHWAIHGVYELLGKKAGEKQALLCTHDYSNKSECYSAHVKEDRPLSTDLSPRIKLREGYEEAFEGFLDRRSRLFTPDGVAAEIEVLECEAFRGCGLIYELFVQRFSEYVDGLLHEIPSELHALAIARSVESGYATPAERAESHAEFKASGDCSLTGIEPNCCPCGRHE